MGGGRDARHVFRGDGLASHPELGGDLGHADRIPDEHGIAEQTQTAHLVHHFLIVTRAKDALIGKEDPTGEPMARFPRLVKKLNLALFPVVTTPPTRALHLNSSS